MEFIRVFWCFRVQAPRISAFWTGLSPWNTTSSSRTTTSTSESYAGGIYLFSFNYTRIIKDGKVVGFRRDLKL